MFSVIMTELFNDKLNMFKYCTFIYEILLSIIYKFNCNIRVLSRLKMTANYFTIAVYAVSRRLNIEH